MIKHELKLSYFALALLVILLGWDDFEEHILTPKPYKNVNVVLAEVVDGKFNLVADFTTTDCLFRVLEVVSLGLGGPKIMTWQDNDGLGQHHERLKGDHTLRITSHITDPAFDKIEVRTRHLCDFELVNGEPVGGEFVDRVFMEYDP